MERRIKPVIFAKHLDLSPLAPIFLFLNGGRHINLLLFLISLFTDYSHIYIAASSKEETHEKK